MALSGARHNQSGIGPGFGLGTGRCHDRIGLIWKDLGGWLVDEGWVIARYCK